MKNCLTLVLLVFSQFIFGQTDHLYRIIEDGKIGYMNNQGVIVIDPIYLEGGEFSEGLASFRINGQYGFIDKSGEIVIPAIYDYVGNFYHGIADVYINNEVYFINKKGNQIIPEEFTSLRFIDENTFVYTTKEKKSGIYNLKTASYVLEPQEFTIHKFTNGLAVAYRDIPDTYNDDYGIIDTSGKFVVNFGVYRKIEQFHAGYARVEIKDNLSEYESTDGVINTKGVLLFSRPLRNKSYLRNDFYEGVASISLYKYWIPETEGVYSSSKNSYMGYIDSTGTIVLDDTLIDHVYNFSNNRAFIQKKHKSYMYYVIDQNFKILNEEPIGSVKNDRFKDGYAIVAINRKWGIIDSNLNYIVPCEYEDIDDIGIVDSMFFYGISDGGYGKIHGIKNLSGRIILEPCMQVFDPNGFKGGLLKAIMDNKLTYLDATGTIIWQEKPQEIDEMCPIVNITCMARGHFNAYSKTVDGKHKSGGWSVSNNEPQTLTTHNSTLGLVVEEDNFQIFIKNYSAETISFDASDSRLYMKLQAKDSKGEWKDIEYLPSSDCGNSYHSIKLPPNSYWEFSRPNYEGDFKTLVRAEIKYTNPSTNEREFIYSNEFKASINPGQFWRKGNYSPRGIMDPYGN